MIKEELNDNCTSIGNCKNFNAKSKKFEDMIEFNGINKNFPENSTTFTQFSLKKKLCIPKQKPDIERIVRLDTKIVIDDYKIIKTPIATSLEGQKLTGYKLLVSGRVKQVVMYVADREEQSVHSAHFEESFCKYIVLPKNFNILTSIKVIPYIEDVSISDKGNRCFCECINIFLDTRFCVNCKNDKKNNCFNSCTKTLGINKELPVNPLYFKELIVEDNLEIPRQKPNIEGLISITSEVEIISTKIICTEDKKSLEGQNLSGCKLIIQYKIKDLLIYTAEKLTQPVHSAHYESNFKSAFIIVPCEINGMNINQLLEECKLKIIPYIEDICVKQKDNRNIKRCLTLLFDVMPICIRKGYEQ